MLPMESLRAGDGDPEDRRPTEVYIARQPIFDRRRQAVAYELLYRSGRADRNDATNGNQATAQVIVNTFMSLGVTHVTGGRRAFINFTRDLLLSDYASVLPKDLVVVEILENIEPADQIIAACQALKRLGYKLALDDFVLLTDEYRPLLRLADIVKVDFQGATHRVLAELPAALRPHGVKLLAEKVETDAEYVQAVRWGYDYFQGFFFSRPVLVKGHEIPGFKANYLRVLQQVHREEPDYASLSEVVKSELSLAVRLLRYVNSVAFGWRYRIESIPQALVALGDREFRKWVSLVALTSMGEDRPRELLIQSAIRAHYCESLAELLGYRQTASQWFLVGLLSCLDAIIGRPLSVALETIPLPDQVLDALLGEQGEMADALQSLIAFEQADWESLAPPLHRLGLPLRVISDAYYRAIKATDLLFKQAVP